MTEDKFLHEMTKMVCKELKDSSLLSLLEKRRYKEILEKVGPEKLMTSKFLRFLPAYSLKKDSFLYLEEPFSTGKHVRLMFGKDEPLVVKWYRSGSRNSSYECSIYSQLKKLKCPLPYFSTSYKFWGYPVLVLEKLQKLGKHEDIYKMGCQVLDQLQYLHTFGVHCDIKPDNIMKREEKGKIYYFLIDYGGVTKEPLEYGYRRWIWSKHWTSQTPHTRKQVVTGRHDFKELAFTMNYLKDSNIDHKKEFSGRLKKFMKRVKKVNKTNIKPKDYEDLIQILS